MDRKSYKAFALIEMLIVMGILVILMVVGIAAGRFATQRAQDIAHQNAAAQIYQALQSYYVDFGRYPNAATPAVLLGSSTAPGDVGKYMDLGAFDGGNDATFYYFVNGDTHQSVIVCVTLGGPGDTAERGIYCDGNGFGDDGLTLSETVTAATMPKGRLEYVGTSIGPAVGVDYYNAVIGEKTNISEWDGKNNKWTTGGGHGVILPVEEKQP